MEVIARKAHVEFDVVEIIATIILTLFAIGIIVMMVNLDLGKSEKILLSFFSVGFFMLSIFGILKYIRYYKTPEEILYYDGERIISSKGSFLPSEIKNIKYSLAWWFERRRGPIHYYSWGKLRLTVGKKKFPFTT